MKNLLIALALSAAVVGPAEAQQATRETVAPQGMSITTTLSPGIKIGDMLYVSGQLPARGDSTIQGQTKSALDNIKAVVEAGGSTMARVVKCTVFLVDVKDFQGMNSVYS